LGFYKDSTNIYRVEALDSLPWLVHGFGTRWNSSFGSCGNLATLKQIHSDLCIHAGGRAGVLGQGDALLSDAPGTVVAVKTADCLPVLLVDERNRAVAAVHAGWRGTVQEIAPKALARMGASFGTKPEDVHAALGPAIAGCCFEVGPEVASEFRRFLPDVPVNGKTKIDLYAVNRRQLAQAGLNPSRIHSAGLCTVCSGDFHSFRRDREKAGRMLSVAGIR
jgi:polyphenol oxidase